MNMGMRLKKIIPKRFISLNLEWNDYQAMNWHQKVWDLMK